MNARLRFLPDSALMETRSSMIILGHGNFLPSTWLGSNAASQKWGYSALAAGEYEDAIPSSIVLELHDKVINIWSGIVMDSSLVTLEKISVLDRLIDIAILLYREYTSIAARKSLVFIETIFKHFPYISIDASLSKPGSQTDITGKRAVGKLNSSVCEVVFVAYQGSLEAESTVEVSLFTHRMTDAIEFLVDELKQYIQRLEESHHDQLVVSDSSERAMDSDILTKVFHCLKVYLCSESSLPILNLFMQTLRAIAKRDLPNSPLPQRTVLRPDVSSLLIPMSDCVCSLIFSSASRCTAIDYLAQQSTFDILLECVSFLWEFSLISQSSIQSRGQKWTEGHALPVASSAESTRGEKKQADYSAKQSSAQRCLPQLTRGVLLMLTQWDHALQPVDADRAAALSHSLRRCFVPLSPPAKGVLLFHSFPREEWSRLFDIYFHLQPLVRSEEERLSLSSEILLALADDRVDRHCQSYFLGLLFER